MGPQYACQSISHLFYDNTLSQSPHHERHPYHEERQQEEDGGVAEGVAHAVVEEWPISDMTSNMQPLTGLWVAGGHIIYRYGSPDGLAG